MCNSRCTLTLIPSSATVNEEGQSPETKRRLVWRCRVRASETRHWQAAARVSSRSLPRHGVGSGTVQRIKADMQKMVS
jgi:hypothetical protein